MQQKSAVGSNYEVSVDNRASGGGGNGDGDGDGVIPDAFSRVVKTQQQNPAHACVQRATPCSATFNASEVLICSSSVHVSSCGCYPDKKYRLEGNIASNLRTQVNQ